MREDVEEIEEYEEEESPLKRKLISHDYRFMFKCQLVCTKKMNTTVRFELINGIKLDNKVTEHLSGYFLSLISNFFSKETRQI